MNLVFQLLNLTTIARLIADVDISEVFHNSLLSGSKARVESSKERGRYVVQGFDQIQFGPRYGIYNRKDDRLEGIDKKFWKPIPLVSYKGDIMICGLTTNFTQPIGYFLTSSLMKSLLPTKSLNSYTTCQ